MQFFRNSASYFSDVINKKLLKIFVQTFSRFNSSEFLARASLLDFAHSRFSQVYNYEQQQCRFPTQKSCKHVFGRYSVLSVRKVFLTLSSNNIKDYFSLKQTLKNTLSRDFCKFIERKVLMLSMRGKRGQRTFCCAMTGHLSVDAEFRIIPNVTLKFELVS